MKKVILASCIGWVAICLAGCSSSHREVAPSSSDTVVINMMKFNPDTLYVNKGDTVVWINKGIVPHDVTEYPGKAWTSDTIPVGHTWKKVIDTGFHYFCSIHATMKGVIRIKNGK